MVDKVREPKVSKKKNQLKEIEHLIKQAEKIKSGYDYPAALEQYDNALKTLDLQVGKNGGDEKRLLTLRFRILDGRAQCYNLLAQAHQENKELIEMERLATQLMDPSRRVNVINRLAELNFVMGESEEGESLSRAALELAKINGERDEEAQSLMLLSQVQFQIGETEESDRNNKLALAIFRDTGNLPGQSRCLRNMAFNGARSGEQTKNVELYAKQALELARQDGDHRSEADSLNVMGIVSSDVALTRDYYKLALDIFTTIGAVGGQMRIANNLGILFWRLGLYGQANYYSGQSTQDSRAIKNNRALAVSLEGLGRSWFELGELDRAEEVFEEGLILSKEHADAFDIAGCLMGLARIAYERGEYQKAIDSFKEQIKLLEGQGDVPETAVILAWMGVAYLKLGDYAQAERATSRAVSQLLSTNPNTDLLDQEVWWARYQVLQEQTKSVVEEDKGPDQSEMAYLVLDKARVTMMDNIASISDEGLRRNYLTKIPVNRHIIEQWTHLFYNHPEFEHFIHPVEDTGDLQEQFKRLSEIGSRLSTQRDPDKLPDFVMNEVVELNGAERAFLAVRSDDGDLETVSCSGIDFDQANLVIQDSSVLIDQAIDTRYTVLKEEVGNVPDGEVPELHKRSVLVVPLVSQSKVLGVIYADLRQIFGSFNQNDIDLLTVLANQAASALESAKWTRTLEVKVEERTAEIEVANTLLEQQNADLAVINEIQQGLAAKLDFQEIIDLVGDKLLTIFANQELSIMLYDAETN
ncbi:MAG: GAF domain-containing protein, partial [Anaerolineales bacterium]|nr:GAF domain-containing protein [Anaerolineales bacterium]